MLWLWFFSLFLRHHLLLNSLYPGFFLLYLEFLLLLLPLFLFHLSLKLIAIYLLLPHLLQLLLLCDAWSSYLSYFIPNNCLLSISNLNICRLIVVEGHIFVIAFWLNCWYWLLTGIKTRTSGLLLYLFLLLILLKLLLKLDLQFKILTIFFLLPQSLITLNGICCRLLNRAVIMIISQSLALSIVTLLNTRWIVFKSHLLLKISRILSFFFQISFSLIFSGSEIEELALCLLRLRYLLLYARFDLN